MGETFRKFDPNDPITAHSAAAITGGRMVANSAAPQTDGTPTVNVPAAAATTFGVARFDAAIGTKTTIERAGSITWIEVGAAVAFGELIETDNLGRAIPRTAGIVQGRCIKAQSTVGQKALIDYRPAFL